ncbi:MAG: nucleoside phosphorylase [Bacteroidota bacterium]
MKKPIPPSELILNPDGSIYHLNLRPDQIAPTIILVGDPDRVGKVSRHFDRIEHRVQKREFITHTGYLGDRRLTVLSTGIGTDNIDIVMNELDALVNIDLNTRLIKEELTSLDFIRIGTSGILSKDIGVDELLISSFGIGLDSLLPYYTYPQNEEEKALSLAFSNFSNKQGLPVQPLAAAASDSLLNEIGTQMHRGITLTCPGFYGPQGRIIRLPAKIKPSFFAAAGEFQFHGHRLANFEMETSAIYGMASMLGHRAVSCNALIANRITNVFSKDPKGVVEKLIVEVLGRLDG